jgi:hypothetical protein
MQDNSKFINNWENEPPIDWDDLYDDLKNERAVLVLGPEFHTNNGVSIKELIYKELIKKEDHGILHFYPSNGIFLFESQKYKNSAQKFASHFYKSLEVHDDIVQKIIELPFRMVINTNPDKILETKYKEKDIECQFDYFTWRSNKREKPISEPDNFYPLIFNLFGSVDSYDSIVLDFEDIFDHLKALLNNTNVSEVIRSVLNETDTYIFIGFHLEKWDTQLLFRYLNMKEHGFDDSKKNYTTRSINIDTTSESFFRKQFNLKYYGAPVDFLNQMHMKYFELSLNEDNKLIKNLSPKEVIDHYISLDEIEKSLNYLTAYTLNNDKSFQQELIMLKANFSRYKFLLNKRLERGEELEIQRNKIKHGILELTKSLQ